MVQSDAQDPDFADLTDSRSRKRRSLNVLFADQLQASFDDFSSSSDGSLDSPGTEDTSIDEILEPVTMHDRLLKERLLELARSDNARLQGRNVANRHYKSMSTTVLSVTSTPSSTHKRSSSIVDDGYYTRSLKEHHRQIRRLRRKRSSIYVMAPEDLRHLDTGVSNVSAAAVEGPVRPANIRGTVLSWQMTADIIRALSGQPPAQSLGTPVQTPAGRRGDLWDYLWTMYSRPEHYRLGASVLPPPRLVKTLAGRLPRASTVAGAGIRAVVAALCVVFACVILCVQLALLAVMVAVYYVGEAVSWPLRRMFQKNGRKGPAKKGRRRKRVY